MKKIFVFLAITIVQIFFNQGNAQTTYSGTVEYKYTRTKTGSGSGSNGYNWNAKADEKYIVEGRFNVVFSGSVSPSGVAMFPIKSISEKVNFISTTDNEAQGERVSQACFDAVKRVSYTVSPGKSQIYKLAIESERLEPDKPCITSGFMGIQCPPSDNKQGNCKYSIMLSGFIKANVTSAIYTEETFPCNKANNKPANLFTNTVKLDFPILIHVEKDFHITDEILEGETIVTDIHNTDCRGCLDSGLKSIIPDIDDVNCAYNETSKISWHLEKQCEALDKVGDELDKRKDISQSQKNRIKNVLAKLKDPSVDPYVFTTMESFRTVKYLKESDIVLNDKETYMTDLRKIYNKWCEEKNIEDLAKSITTLDKQIVTIVNKLQEYYLREHMLSPGQVVIKDWIADQQRNPNSIYSCYPGE
ncbi:MAG: hypothetical protein E4G94_08420 [ANME-2 cluster archaeon]|nr:MAG: hypothetical protein E4G94_08420 [ANME-2 cluster archaeon]